MSGHQVEPLLLSLKQGGGGDVGPKGGCCGDVGTVATGGQGINTCTECWCEQVVVRGNAPYSIFG